VELVAGRYRLESMIGRGGAGAVWRAKDHQLGRPVAIKQIVTNEHRSTRSRARALREGQVIAQLRTPGVVEMYDVIDVGPYVYLVMELVDAPSLSRRVRRDGPLDPADAAAAGRSMLSTLDAIHRAGIVHRDIKPSNILVDGATWRLTDFGIALLGDGQNLTAAGSVLGTPAYMAPEQASGERSGPPADLYGLGASLYFAVEGHAPFTDTGSWETTQAVRTQPPRPGVRLGVIEPVVDALLVKDPGQRPSSAEVDTALAVAAGAADEPPLRKPMVVTIDKPAVPPRAALSPDDDGHQLRRLALWVVLSLVLLALALVLLFVAVREQRTDVAALGVAVLPVYHGGIAVRRRSRSWIKSTHCAPSSSPARSSPPS
jgi:serine/threonine protein kinase